MPDSVHFTTLHRHAQLDLTHTLDFTSIFGPLHCSACILCVRRVVTALSRCYVVPISSYLHLCIACSCAVNRTLTATVSRTLVPAVARLSHLLHRTVTRQVAATQLLPQALHTTRPPVAQHIQLLALRPTLARLPMANSSMQLNSSNR